MPAFPARKFMKDFPSHTPMRPSGKGEHLVTGEEPAAGSESAQSRDAAMAHAVQPERRKAASRLEPNHKLNPIAWGTQQVQEKPGRPGTAPVIIQSQIDINSESAREKCCAMGTRLSQRDLRHPRRGQSAHQGALAA